MNQADATLSDRMLPSAPASELPRSDMSWDVLPRSAQVYVAAVMGCGSAVLVALFPTTLPQPWLFVGLIIAACLTASWKVNLLIPLGSGSTLSVACAAQLGALLLLGRTVIERSLREGFELAPFEALWKRTPVVGGLPLAIRDGVDGFLAPEAGDAAARIVELVRDPGLAIEMGRAGRERVREHFLVTAALERELRALAATVQAR